MPPAIASSTTLKVTIAGMFSLCVIVATGTWKASGYLSQQADATRETNRQLQTISDQLKRVSADSWRVSDQQSWAKDLRWENRNLPLTVPEPRPRS